MGRPAIGAAVFAWKLQDAAQAQADPFARLTPQAGSDKPNRLFFFGSVFGGTGAAAMPTLPRLIRQRFGEQPVSCGGALLLPYFHFHDQNDHDRALYAHPAEFPANTRAALNYYHDHLSGVYENLYVLGCDQGRELGNQYCAGGSQQNNPPHVVEMLAALAATEFLKGEAAQHLPGAPLDARVLVMAGREEVAATPLRFAWEDVPQTNDVRAKFGIFERMCLAFNNLLSPQLQRHFANPNERVPWIADLGLNADDRASLESFSRFCTGFLNWTRNLHDEHNGLNMKLIDVQKARDNQLRGLVIDSRSQARTVDDVWRLMCSDRDQVVGSRFGSLLLRLRNACV